MTTLSFKDAPHDWAICFQDDCPLHDRCLRHRIALLAPAGLTHHTTVLPAARQDDHCALFATAEPVCIARGMKHMLPRRKIGIETQIREKLYVIFGSRSRFYRYCDGEYDITPEQQQQVINLLRNYGIQSQKPFDTYNIQYFFPKP